jgi:hypothetical protein
MKPKWCFGAFYSLIGELADANSYRFNRRESLFKAILNDFYRMFASADGKKSPEMWGHRFNSEQKFLSLIKSMGKPI